MATSTKQTQCVNEAITSRHLANYFEDIDEKNNGPAKPRISTNHIKRKRFGPTSLTRRYPASRKNLSVSQDEYRTHETSRKWRVMGAHTHTHTHTHTEYTTFMSVCLMVLAAEWVINKTDHEATHLSQEVKLSYINTSITWSSSVKFILYIR